MPRSKCTQTIEHRLTLGTYERAELKKVVKAEKVKDYAEAANQILLPLGVVAVAAGIGIAGRYIGQGLSELEIWPSFEFGDTREDGTKMTLSELIIGKKEYTFNTSDGGTKTFRNYGYPIPVVGVISGAMINLGEATADAIFGDD